MDQVRGSESCDKEQESTDCLDEPGYADKYHGKSTAQWFLQQSNYQSLGGKKVYFSSHYSNF